jgi:hypothetical protein
MDAFAYIVERSYIIVIRKTIFTYLRFLTIRKLKTFLFDLFANYISKNSNISMYQALMVEWYNTSLPCL